MPNIVYNAGLKQLLTGVGAWDTATYKVLLERSTSTYSPNKDDGTISGMSGLVEISVTGYERQAVANAAVTVDNTNDEVMLDCDDVDFGTLASGQTVKAIIFYRHVGNDSQNIPLLYIDTDSGGLLPRALGGGNFKVVISSDGLMRFKQGT